MKKSYCTLLLLLTAGLASLAAHAQASFRPGYIVRPAGDTLRGEVQAVGALRNALVCRFRPTAGGAVTEYVPASLRAYGILHEAVYETQPVPPADSTQAPAPQPFFVEVLVAGRARLYSLRNRDRHTRYFVAVGAPNAPLQELAERRVKTFSNGFDAYETQARYRSTLAAALRDCPSVQVQLPALPFSQAALIQVVARYNECVGGAVASKAILRERDKVLMINLLLGYQWGNLSNEFQSLASSAHTGLAGGLAVGLTLPHTRHTISARLEAFYSAENYKQSQLNQRYLSLPMQLRYTLLRSRVIRPFAEAGIIYSYLLHAESANPVQTGQFGFVAGLGASVPLAGPRRLGVLVRLTSSESLTNPGALGSRNTSISTLLSFDLLKPSPI